jgi:hypothetical protein
MGSPVPPGQPLDLELRLIFLRHEYRPDEESTRVQTKEFSGSGKSLGTWEMEYRDQQPATAVLEHLLRRATQVQRPRFVVAMESCWLAKLLVQGGTEVRSLGLFQRLRELHRVAGRTLVLGPVAGPPQVSTEAVGSARAPR